MASARALYLDASALVKLVLSEPQSAALASFVADADLLSSEIAVVELGRAVQREPRGAELRGPANYLLDRTTLLPLTRNLLVAAAELRGDLRSLDAIHVVTAVETGAAFAFVSYDRRQAAAAKRAGLVVEAPA